MKVIDTHIHMIARTTQDYETMARMGCVACCEPAFWAGYDRTSSAAFHDYFTHLTECEPKRAIKYGIKHFCWICINSKESDNLLLAREVIKLIPPFLEKENVLGIGEIGLNKNTHNELIIFEEQIQLAVQFNQMVLIHTPHLEDKYKGTQLMLDVLKNYPQLSPSRVCFDHTEEHTIKMVLDQGFWAGMTIYPNTKNSPPRAVDTIEQYGLERILVDTSGDWGPSGPVSLHDTIFEMRRRGHNDTDIEQLFYKNPVQFLSQNPKFAKHQI